MLFSETLEKVKQEVDKAIDELFSAALSNQTHPQDLLLVLLHGFHDEDFKEYADLHGLSHYMFGPSYEGWAEQTQYEFYDAYRQSLCEVERDVFIQEVKSDEDLEFREKMSIHLEMML